MIGQLPSVKITLLCAPFLNVDKTSLYDLSGHDCEYGVFVGRGNFINCGICFILGCFSNSSIVGIVILYKCILIDARVRTDNLKLNTPSVGALSDQNLYICDNVCVGKFAE